MPASIIQEFPDCAAVSIETDVLEVNKMLRAGWRLLCPPAKASDSAGEYFVYSLGKPRAAETEVQS